MKWLVAAAIAFLADLFLHLPVTDVFDFMATRFGFFTYDRITKYVFLAIGVVCLLAAWRWTGNRRKPVLLATVVLLALAALFQAFTLVAGIENIHYPQYALLMYLLARGLRHTEVAWLTAIGLGFLDETYQYLALPRGTPNYLDWNDILLNAVGAAFGVVLVVARRANGPLDQWTTGPVAGPLLTRTAAFSVAAVVITIALVLSPPAAPFYTVSPGGRPFHLLSASEAISVISLLWLGVQWLTGAANATPYVEPSPNRPPK